MVGVIIAKKLRVAIFEKVMGGCGLLLCVWHCLGARDCEVVELKGISVLFCVCFFWVGNSWKFFLREWLGKSEQKPCGIGIIGMVYVGFVRLFDWHPSGAAGNSFYRVVCRLLK